LKKRVSIFLIKGWIRRGEKPLANAKLNLQLQTMTVSKSTSEIF